MYKFNQNLLEAFPKLLGIKHKDFKEVVGIPYSTYLRWLVHGVSSMALFTDILNRLHLSFADFIITEKYPFAIQSKENYLIPDSVWAPIQWMPHKLSTLYGENSLTGVSTKFALAKKLNIGSYQRLDRWVIEATPLSVREFLNIINTLQLDARIFINDPNKYIERPVFEWEKNVVSKRKEELEGEVKKLRYELDVRNKQILKLNNEIKLIQKGKEQNLIASNKGVSAGFVAESKEFYGRTKKGYTFHKELWNRLPEVFDFTVRTVCLELGISTNSFLYDNVKVETVIKVCNYLRVSFTHFIRPISEPSVIRDKGYYVISSSLFKPIENHMHNLRYIFKRSTFGLTGGNLKDIGICWSGKESLISGNGKRCMMVTLANVCTEFNIPPSSFIYDPNERKRAVYSVSLNETLINNCIQMSKTIEDLKKKNQKLREEIKQRSETP